MPKRFLVLQSSYKVLSIGLCENEKIIDRFLESKLTPSASLVPHAMKLLARNELALRDISAIIVDQGPGAFSSLRVLLSTANALGFAIQLPLIGVDGLDALAFDTAKNYSSFYQAEDKNIILVPFLNAYNVECYYGIYEANLAQKTISIAHTRGYAKVYTLLDELNEKYPSHSVVFVGNGVPLYSALIQEKLAARAFWIEDRFDLASLDIVANYGYEQWLKNQPPTYKLMPLYLKSKLFSTASK